MTERKQSLHILQHALGLDDYGQGEWYRNRYVSGPECDGFDLCMAHVEAGRMKRHGPREMYGGSYCFAVTEEGKQYVREKSPAPPPKLTIGKRRYQKFLDEDSGLTFREWLKDGRKP